MSTSPTPAELLKLLAPALTDERRERMRTVLAERTRFIAVALEDLWQPHNASAVIRTCDCLGVQPLHVIENRNSFRVNEEIALGASQWIEITRWKEAAVDNTAKCLAHLKASGYRVAVTALRADAVNLEELPLDVPTAFVFGNELTGARESTVAQADVAVRLPMYGFTQSYNISVTVAICLSYVVRQIRNSAAAWRLTAAEQDEVLLGWYRASLGERGKAMERRLSAI